MSGDVGVEVDHERCYGAQNCGRVAPGAFTYDELGKSIPVTGRSGVDPEQIRTAAAQCPAMAITILQDNR